MSEIIHITNKNFDEVVSTNKAVLIDFFAAWCGPCKMLTPILEQIVKENRVGIPIGKLDIDQCLEIAQDFGVMSVPTMILFKDGKEIGRIIGLRNKEQLVKEIKEALEAVENNKNKK